MNKISRRLVLTIMLSVVYCVANAQIADVKRVGNGIYILPSQLVFPEILLTYEHFLNNDISICSSVGYKIPTGKGDYLAPFTKGLFSLYEYSYIFNEYSHGLYFSLAPALYITNSKNLYISSEFFYRYYWFNNKKLFFNNMLSTRYNSIRSEHNHVLGCKVLMGVNSKIEISDKRAIAFKIYMGLGARYKIYKYENVNNIDRDGKITPYEKEQGVLYQPFTIHFGLKVGLSGLVSIKKQYQTLP